MSKRIDDFLSLSELKDDFSQDTPCNEKVKKFKELVKKYEEKQKNFEKSKELFSPYCIGYGNITSPIWYIGEAEGGPCGIINCSKCNNKSKDSERYNREVKTKGVLSEEHIKEKVFTPVGELLKKYSLIKDENEMIDRYINFKFALEIRKNVMEEEINSLRLGEWEFFTEYWRYRAPAKCLEGIVKRSNPEWDKEREEFLLELYKIFLPRIIVAYSPANKRFDNNKTTRDKIKELFINRLKIFDFTKERWDNNLKSHNSTIMLIIEWPKKYLENNKEKENIINIVKELLKGG